MTKAIQPKAPPFPVLRGAGAATAGFSAAAVQAGRHDKPSSYPPRGCRRVEMEDFI